MIRPSRSLLSAPLATMTIAALALWGCGGGGGSNEPDGGGGNGGMHTGGSGGGTGGRAGGSGGSSVAGSSGGGGTTGIAGTGGGAAGTGVAGTSGVAGAGGTTGVGGATGGTTGVGGAAGIGTGGAAGTGVAGTSGTGGAGGSVVMVCTAGMACGLPNNVKGICNSTGTMCLTCGGSDAACQAAYGAGDICVNNNCVTGNCHASSACNGQICSSTTNACTACTADSDCMTAFGTNYFCQSGTCAQGACQTAAECGGGQLCNGSHQCVPCTTDVSCGSGKLCIAGGCVTGTCRTGLDCGTASAGGPICAVSTHTCGPCTDDNSCQTSYNAQGYLCGPGNSCIVGNCRTAGDCSNGKICVNNACTTCTQDNQCVAGQLCLSGGCVTGNCRLATDCPSTNICTANNCGSCAIDGDCVAAYGNNHLCQGGACVAGNCRATGDCAASGQICNTGTLSCQPCAGDGDCTTGYGANHLCVGGVCIAGNCRGTTSGAPNCSSAGQICNTNNFTCAICGADTDCQAASAYGAGHLCQNSACIVGQCRVAPDCGGGQICNVGNFTCGACATTLDCTNGYGTNHVCSNGACISGNCNTSTDCGGNQICTGNACVGCSTDGQCTSDPVYGAQHLCIGSQCIPGNCRTSGDCSGGQQCNTGTHMCVACGSDTSCQSDSTYGNGTICLTGACTTGNCHDTSDDCPGGQLCGISAPHTCGACSLDTQCTGDAHYGAGDICYQGACAAGNCHANSGDCTGANAGAICGATMTNTCGTCTTDSQCKSDPFYGNTFICNTTAGASAGKCVSASCATNDVSCGANTADFCCGSLCVGGNCCNNTDCANNPMFGVGYACTGNSCSHCDAISGNTYYVDPVNGNDTSASGSGKSSGAAVAACSFKTLNRVMAVIGAFAGANTQVVIVGSSGSTIGLDPSDALPIIVQPNVIISTTGGPIKITLKTTAAGVAAGFRLLNSGSGINGNPAAPLTLDGNAHNAGIAIQVAPASGAVSVANVSIQNTLGDSISVTAGTLNVGAGVVVTGSSADGLHVTGGVANITVPAGQTQTAFNSNNFGIDVGALGSVNVTGVAVTPPTGGGTVVANTNAQAGIRVSQTAGAAGLATNTITGLVAWQNTNWGARFFGWSKVKVRSSVFGGNVVDGILMSQGAGAGSTAAQQRTISTMDLGAVGDFGLNWIQTPTGALGHNSSAGLCVNLGGAATGTLNLAGNQMVTGAGVGSQVNCAATAATVTKQANGCSNGSSLSNPAATTYTVVLNNCN